MTRSSYNNFFSNFANPTRFKIIMILQGKEMSVGEIVEATKEEQSKVSHNLRILAGCHIVSVRQEGKKRMYSLNKDTVLPMLKLGGEHVKKYCIGKCVKVKKC